MPQKYHDGTLLPKFMWRRGIGMTSLCAAKGRGSILVLPTTSRGLDRERIVVDVRRGSAFVRRGLENRLWLIRR